MCLTEEDKQKFDGILLKAEAHLYAVQTFGSIVQNKEAAWKKMNM